MNSVDVSQSDRAFFKKLENGIFDVADFDHRSHVRLGYVCLIDFDLECAFRKMKSILFGLLEQAKISPEQKFHHTMTEAWLMAIQHMMHHSLQSDDFEAFINQFPQLLNVGLLSAHYSKERLFSEQARSVFLEPDIMPFPNH